MLQNAQNKTPKTKHPITKRPKQQNAHLKKNTQFNKTPNATKGQITKRPMLQNVQNKVRDSILFNI